MSLLSKITTTPLAFDPGRAADFAPLWPRQDVTLDVATGIAASSPYLFATFSRHAEWISAALEDDAKLTEIFEPVTADVGQVLRERKAKVAGYLAFAELSGASTLEQATTTLTRFADFAVETAFDFEIKRLQATGKLPPEVGLFVLAMGKMGAFELNYSSDIDLIVMFDDTRHERSEAQTIRSILNRVTRAATKSLSELTGDGYVFRTDLRLRPDPSVTPVCVPMSQALAYYESLGRTWERAAFIKARCCAGDIGAGEQFLTALRPFIWRKHLDFAAIEDAHDLVQKIRAKNPSAGHITLPGHNLKLGRGGIREIEFFTQTRQLIAGGRDKSLRSMGTLDGLIALVQAGWVEPDDAAILSKAYRALRHAEHAVQMVRDAQTATVPFSVEGIERVAALRGQTPDAFEQDICGHLNAVQSITERFFEQDNPDVAAPAVAAEFEDMIARWHGYRAFRTERALKLFDRLSPHLFAKLSSAANPQDAWSKFDVFLGNLPAGVQLFSLFCENPKLIDLVTDIVCASPDLALHLAQNSSVLDAVLSGGFFHALPDEASYVADLSKALMFGSDFEADLDLARVWAKEAHFQISVHFLQGLVTADKVGLEFAQLGRAVLAVMLKLAQSNMERRYGVIPDSAVSVVSMGSLATGRMTANSDLDLLLIFDADPNKMSDGKRELGARQYFSKLTQMLISALSAPTAKGTLYEVDMRLRPSGRAGPVALRFESFESYQNEDAWTWEHLVLTQARPVAGDATLCDRIGACIGAVLKAKSGWDNVSEGWHFMLDKLDQMPASATLDPKQGQGGLQRIELLLQTCCLANGTRLRSIPDALTVALDQSLISKDMVGPLQQSWALQHDFRQCLALLNPMNGEIRIEGDVAWSFIERHCGIASQNQLDAALKQHRMAATEIEHSLRQRKSQDGRNSS